MLIGKLERDPVGTEGQPVIVRAGLEAIVLAEGLPGADVARKRIVPGIAGELAQGRVEGQRLGARQTMRLAVDTAAREGERAFKGDRIVGVRFVVDRRIGRERLELRNIAIGVTRMDRVQRRQLAGGFGIVFVVDLGFQSVLETETMAGLGADGCEDRLAALGHKAFERGVAVDFLARGQHQHEVGCIENIDPGAPLRVMDLLNLWQYVDQRHTVEIDRRHLAYMALPEHTDPHTVALDDRMRAFKEVRAWQALAVVADRQRIESCSCGHCAFELAIGERCEVERDLRSGRAIPGQDIYVCLAGPGVA